MPHLTKIIEKDENNTYLCRRDKGNPKCFK